MLGENLRETPDFVKSVVKGRRRDADQIWFAEIAFHIGRDEFFVQLLRMLVRQDRQLAAARVWITWRDDSKLFRSDLREQELKITGQSHCFRPERLHPSRL